MKTGTLSLLTTTGAILRPTRSKRLVTLPLILRNLRSSSLVQPETPLRLSEAKIEALESLWSKFTTCHYSFSPGRDVSRFCVACWTCPASCITNRPDDWSGEILFHYFWNSDNCGRNHWLR